MATNLVALQAAVKLVADAVDDGIKAAGDSSALSKAMEFENLLADLINLLPQIGDIPSEASQLQTADYISLLGSLGADLVLPAGKAQNILSSSIKFISDIASVMVPDVEALIAAIKG
jgi:hypothetical protein